jgi:uncharacterized repeat protein (TIGR03803 family)
VHRFANTGKGTQSQFALGATPVAELLQASDGNFYGTTTYGGSGVCTNAGGTIIGCGTIFQMTPKGAVTVLYSFFYDTSTGTAPGGVFPTAGLIQGKDGYLYGVASDGGIAGCNGALGCGTMFRISTTGGYTMLHQFCNNQSCPNSVEGGRPMAHLIQLQNKTLCGTTAAGGSANQGTLFCASTSGTVNTLYDFDRSNGTDGYDPQGALLVGANGTLYGTTIAGGAMGGGTVFAYRSNKLTTLHAFDSSESSTPGTYFMPMGAVIFGADGKLYGTTYSGGTAGCIYALNTDGTGFAPNPVFDGNNSANALAGFPVVGLVLARDRMMYGTTEGGSTKPDGNNGGTIYRFDPATAAYKGLASFTSPTGYAPRAALIEATDNSLWGTTSLHGEKANNSGTDEGTVYRLAPPLTQ